ncbi:MAG: homoserine dehydrogenase [Desulfovibrio sp.]|uniref:homoserine dehydrogenase n=1 Tax=Desulfovibrio sp. 7SRBS1 TaxID=3378064 RepID=UPI003B41483C
MGKKATVLGIAGFGTVGTGLARILDENRERIIQRMGCDIRIKTILVRDLTKTRTYTPTSTTTSGTPENTVRFTATPADLVNDPEIDIIVELMGGIEAAYDLISLALKAGKHVVTANKALLAERGQELFALAREKNLCLYYEASSVGGVPVIQTLKESLASNRILKLTGIMNGTANYILSEMSSNGLDFSTALAQAQELGYAEADPSFDIDGVDTAHKLVLLMRLAFGQHYALEDLPVSGIRNVAKEDISFAREFGYRLKLIGQARDVDGAIEAGVFPALVKYTFLLARVGGNYNAVRIEGNAVGPIMLHGQGAGDLPTGSAVLSDVMAIIKDKDRPNNTGWTMPELPPANILPPEQAVSQHYFRFSVADRPGVMGTIASAMAEHDISIAQAIQKGNGDQEVVPVVFITHEAPMGSVKATLDAIEHTDFIAAPTVHYRIL